jgi:hypothetical protein
MWQTPYSGVGGDRTGSLKKTNQTVEGELLDWYEKFGGASFQKY